MMTMCAVTLKQASECLTCGGEWSMESDMEKYCGKCNSYLINIDGEIYQQQGW